MVQSKHENDLQLAAVAPKLQAEELQRDSFCKDSWIHSCTKYLWIKMCISYTYVIVNSVPAL